MDGIDAVVVRFEPNTPLSPLTSSSYTWLAAETYPVSDALAHALLEARRYAENAIDANLETSLDAPWARALDEALTAAFTEAALNAIHASGLDASQINAIASHGQTIAHRPQANPPVSVQLADPQAIADRTGITTVGRFREADLAAHGQGAPLAPLLHQALFESADARRAIINLGGIANVTCILPGQPVMGFDTGPANVLLDLHHRQHHRVAFDQDGQWAQSGQVLPELLAQCQQDPFFQQPPPKSTSIEHFGEAWLARQLAGFAAAKPADIQATLAELTAATIGEALGAFQPIDEVRLCGGGAHNSDLVERLQRRLPECAFGPVGGDALNVDHLEAFLFAWLGRACLLGHAFDTSSITGAEHPVVLGQIHSPQSKA